MTITRTFFAALASLLLITAAAHANVIPIPNAGFETITKPGSPGVTGSNLTWFTNGIGNGVQLSTCCGVSGPLLNWSDGTQAFAGDSLNVPGWISSAGASGIQGGGHLSSVSAYVQGPDFGGPSSGSTVDSAASLGVIAPGVSYTLKMDATGMNGAPASPSLLELLGNGTPLPTAVVLPNVTSAAWTTYSITYPAADITAFVGDSLTIRFGTGNGAQGAQSQWDNASLTATPEPSSLVLGGLGAIGLFIAARRRRKA